MNVITPILGDANILIKDIEDKSIDLILTDPPYEINFENNKWDKPACLDWNNLSIEFKRVLKSNGSMVIFQGWSHVAETMTELNKHFHLKNWIIYDRVKGRGAKTNLVSTREDILWYVVNPKEYTFNKISSTIKKKTKGMGLKNGNEFRALSNVWSDVPPLVPWSKERVKHPTQKPLFLMKRLLQIYSNECDTVLDPFMGSGSTLVSSQNLNRNCIGFDLDENYFQICNERLKNVWKRIQERNEPSEH
ncbi:MAG: site-specific DNA-methyltransferase [Rhodobacteraceae bacterium]|nr:site-specific DNA-methyltransferase [Paracoccaceae bacterium]